jgi:hypothetical protein
MRARVRVYAEGRLLAVYAGELSDGGALRAVSLHGTLPHAEQWLMQLLRDDQASDGGAVARTELGTAWVWPGRAVDVAGYAVRVWRRGCSVQQQPSDAVDPAPPHLARYVLDPPPVDPPLVPLT